MFDILEDELRRLPWAKVGGLEEFLGRVTLLLMPPNAPALLLLLLLVVAPVLGGSKEDTTLLDGGNEELVDVLLDSPALASGPPACVAWLRGPSRVDVSDVGPWPFSVGGTLTGSWWTGGAMKLWSCS